MKNKTITIYAVQVYRSNTAILLYQVFRKTLQSAQRTREHLKTVFNDCYVTIEVYELTD